MSADAHPLVRRFWEGVWLRRDPTVVDDLFHDPFVRHTEDGTTTFTLAEYRSLLGGALDGVRGAEVVVADTAATGDRVWGRVTLRGVNLPVGTPLTVAWMVCYRLTEDRVAESWTLHARGVDWDR